MNLATLPPLCDKVEIVDWIMELCLEEAKKDGLPFEEVGHHTARAAFEAAADKIWLANGNPEKLPTASVLGLLAGIMANATNGVAET